MNILFTNKTPFHPQYGGVERVTDTLCRELQCLGNQVHYLHLHWGREDFKTYSFPADSVTILPSSNIDDEVNVVLYNQLISNKKIDVVINQNGLFEDASFFCKVHNKNVKLISVIHNNPLLNYKYLWSELTYLRNNTWIERLKRIARCLLYFKIKNQRLNSLRRHYAQFNGENHSILVLLSQQYKLPLLQIAPHLTKKIYAIANPNTYEDIPFIPKKEKELLYVGRLDNRSKKVNRLLKVWKKIHKDFPDWTLSIVGDGPDREILEEYVKKKKLPRLSFCGYSDPRHFYSRASIICMTSDYEGFPMVLTEAMQFGCVPIAYESFEAIKDVIIDGVTGVLVSPFKKYEYVRELKKIMYDSTFRMSMSINAFRYIKKFSVENIVNEWMELMQ